MYASSAAAIGKSGRAKRLLAFAALALGEIFLISYSFNFVTGLPEWLNPVAYAKGAAQAGLLAFVAFLVIVWPQRGAILRTWSEAVQAHSWRASVVANLGLFAIVLASALASKLRKVGQAAPDAVELPAGRLRALEGRYEAVSESAVSSVSGPLCLMQCPCAAHQEKSVWLRSFKSVFDFVVCPMSLGIG